MLRKNTILFTGVDPNIVILIVFVLGVNGALLWPYPYSKFRIFFIHVANMFMCGCEHSCDVKTEPARNRQDTRLATSHLWTIS